MLSLRCSHLLSAGMLVLLASCDAMISESPTQVNWTYEDGSTVTVTVDPSYMSSQMVFHSLEEHHAYLQSLDESGVVRVNAQHWKLLRHAIDPAEISVLDKNRSVVVGEYLYEVEREAVYRRKLNEPKALRAMELFYGKSGNEDLHEFVRAAATRPGAAYSEDDFKNDFAKELAKELGELTKQSATLAKTSSFATCYYRGSTNYRDTMECFVDQPTLFPDGAGIYLPPHYEATPGYYEVRLFLLNSSYRDFLAKRSYGLTETSIRKVGSDDPYFGLAANSCPTYADVVVVRNDSESEYEYTVQIGNYFDAEVTIEGERYVPTKMRQVRLGFSVADGTHVGSNWSRVTTKLRDWRPLLLATSFTAAWGSSGGLIHTFRGGMGTLGIPRMNRSGSRA